MEKRQVLVVICKPVSQLAGMGVRVCRRFQGMQFDMELACSLIRSRHAAVCSGV